MSSPYRIQQHWSWIRLLQRTFDAAGIVFALAGATLGSATTSEQWFAAAVAVVLYSFLAEVTGLYRNWHGDTWAHEILTAGGTWLATALLLIAVAFFTDQQVIFTRQETLRWFILAISVIAGARILVRWAQTLLRTRGFNVKRYAIVGVNELGFQLAKNIEQAADVGLQLAGFYDDREEGRLPEIPAEVGIQCGDLEQLIEQAQSHDVQRIYITFPMRAEERIKKVLQRLSDTTASVYIVPDFFVFELLHSRWSQIGGLPAVSVFENPFYGVDGLVKRILDFLLAAILSVVLAPLLAIIALAVKLTSRGPVFFRQKRYGLDGKEIRVWKFRSMSVCEDGKHVKQATKHDSRITPVGAFLRKTSLDELPQLINVLEGSMSLVGPRPHATAHNEQYRKLIPGYMLRHKVKPGITGLAQVNGWRGETDTDYKMQKRVEFDHKYIREWSPWLDLKILGQTVLTVLNHENAY